MYIVSPRHEYSVFSKNIMYVFLGVYNVRIYDIYPEKKVKQPLFIKHSAQYNPTTLTPHGRVAQCVLRPNAEIPRVSKRGGSSIRRGVTAASALRLGLQAVLGSARPQAQACNSIASPSRSLSLLQQLRMLGLLPVYSITVTA